MIKSLGQVCNGFTKNIALKDLDNLSGNYPVFGASGFIQNIDSFVSPVEYIGIVKDGAGVGRTNKYPANSSLLGTMQYIVPNEEMDIDYLMYAIRYMNLGKNGSGAAIPHIYFKDYKKSLINVREKDEQINISNELNNIENAIKITKTRVYSLDELIKSRFIEMFKNQDYPKTQIRNVVDIKKISAKKTYENDDKIRYIDISSIDNSTNQVIGYTPYVFKDAPSRAQQCLKNGDILVSTVRPNLKNIAIFNGDSTDCVGSSGFCVLRASKCSIQYLKHIVLDDEFTEAMVKLTTGASYPAIRDDDVLDYEMIDAPIELQNEFASFVEKIDKSKFIVQQQIKDLQELLDKKMDEYFGE